MKLTVVGASGSYPGPDSAASCYLVQHEGFSVVLDVGNGSLGALARHIDIHDVDAVLLSHLHPDHCIDLCAWYVARHYRPGGRLPPLDVWGPEGTADRMARAYDLPTDPGMHDEFTFRTWTAGTRRIGPFEVTVDRVVHPGSAWGVRLEAGGRTLTYSGDTDACDALVGLARDADLFLCEASYRDDEINPPGVHLTGAEAGAGATHAGAGRLLITHVPPWYAAADARAEAARTFHGPVELALPGAVHEV